MRPGSECFLLSLALSVAVGNLQGPEVTLSLGKLRGVFQKTINGREISSFLGVPYAQPPIGELRFKEPVPVKSWQETFKADTLPDICFQTNKRNVGSEDCLYLNVFTPKVPERGDANKLDVLFVIHGGGFQNGYGHLHGPEYLLDEKDIVMVSFNYRLGVLGFLSLQDDIMPGNYGLKDQLLALKWVKENIAAFGGDPNKITLIGCSAGSASVEFHLLSQKSKGLFQKAIALSGSVFNPWAIRDQKSSAVQIARALGCPVGNSRATRECLLQQPAELLTTKAYLFVKFLGYDDMAVVPVIEKPSAAAFLDKSPAEIIKSGQGYDVPLLMANTDDDVLFLAAEIFMNSSAVSELESNWEKILPLVLRYRAKEGHESEVAKSIKDFYFGESSISEKPGQLSKLMTDRYLAVGIQKALKLHAENNKSPVYAYLFTHTGGKRLSDAYDHSEIYQGGAVHGDDLFYIFHSPDDIVKRNGDPAEEAMSKKMVDLVMDFIQKSDAPLSSWKTIQSGLPNMGYLEIAGPESSQISFKTKTDFSETVFWNSLPLEENIDVTDGFGVKDEL
ncbi:hypothetical protein GE061_002589 [Apolygus lucorum]|uniref:Carboxylic ester hydrolase n=1 Tax=Apolygus lucorum TaxID=248454 RepID=A0A6A4JEH3_APOLU|nr:hypothetical protein GE061_002589 [Apolygus lucorum]